MDKLLQDKFDELSCCVLIPTYNNEKTLKQVVLGVLNYTSNVILVNDGSTDSTKDIIKEFQTHIHIEQFEKNIGKGKALRHGFKVAKNLGYRYAISIDSDGQHLPEDLINFLEKIEDEPDALIVGARNMDQSSVPGKSSFGHKFSNFWFRLQTGINLPDTQSGYRLYPIQLLADTLYFTNKFEFEIEVIVRAAWKKINVTSVPVKVIYQTGEDRVTHFRPFNDFTRISVLNTFLTLIALLWFIPVRYLSKEKREEFKAYIINAFSAEEPDSKKALAIGFGFFMGIFPVWGYQMLIAILISHFLKLNKVLVVVAANISIPPMIPFIIFGSVKLGGLILGHDHFEGFELSQLGDLEIIRHHLKQYLIGSVTLSLVAGIIGGIITYFILKILRLTKRTNG